MYFLPADRHDILVFHVQGGNARAKISDLRAAEVSDLTKTDDTVVIYTDGGCDPNPGVGAWAAVLIRGDLRKELSGGESESTNNRMELTAAIRAIEALNRPCRVVLHTDSEYLKKGITE